MSQSLAVKYRPCKFEDVCSQKSVIKILTKMIEKQEFVNCLEFAGPSGCGKTTLARIYGNMINKGKGNIIEIDGASNNGVDNIRAIIDEAKLRAIDAEYKIYIIDECHMITTAGWNAFLKCLEDCPKYTIFIFCTTNPEKIPATIQNRVMRLNLSKVDTSLIKERLLYICSCEGFSNYIEACDYISKLSNGGVRDAIAYLEKASNYSEDLSIKNVLECLGNFSYDSFFNLTADLLNQNEGNVLKTIETYYNEGNDLKLFVESYLDFTLDLVKYCLFKDMESVKIPLNLTPRCEGYSSIPDILAWTNILVDRILEIKNIIKNDVNIKTTVEAMFIKICRGI